MPNLRDFLPQPPWEGPPLPRRLRKSNPDLSAVENRVNRLIAELEEQITTSTDPIEVATLKGVVYFLEDNWDELMKEIEWRLEV